MMETVVVAPSSSSRSKGRGGGGAPLSREVPSCGACRGHMRLPCILVCFHVVCDKCASEGTSSVEGGGGKAIRCPICGTHTNLHEGDECPPVDILLKILIEAAQKELSLCANCDASDKASMFFCKTCGQTLCSSCRSETHAAKMFSQHEVVPHAQRKSGAPRKCGVHGEPLSLFCSPKNELFCGKCYEEAEMDLKMNCLDIQTAYKEGIYEVEKSLIRTWDLNASLSQLLGSYRAAESQLVSSLESQAAELQAKYSSTLVLISGAYEGALGHLESSFASRRHEIRSAMATVAHILPTLKMHLLLLSGFAFSASQTEFLGLVYQAINRLNLLSQFSFPERQPPITSNLGTPDAASKFLSTLESLQLHAPEKGPSHSQKEAPRISKASSPPPKGRKTPTHNPKKVHSTPQQQEEEDEESCSQCPSEVFSSQLKDLKRSFGDIKAQMGSLHLQLTSGRPGLLTLGGILSEASILKKEISVLEEGISGRQRALLCEWEEEQKRFLRDTGALSVQLNDLSSLRHSLAHVINLASQIEPYLKAGAAAKQGALIQSLPPPPPPILEEEAKKKKQERGRSKSPRKAGEDEEEDDDETSQEIRCSLSKGAPQLGDLLKLLLSSREQGSNSGGGGGLLCSLFERVRGHGEDGLLKDPTSASEDAPHHGGKQPYEPPGLGKPSRVMPGPPSPPPPPLLESADSVEVLSVIRFNKMKFGSSSGGGGPPVVGGGGVPRGEAKLSTSSGGSTSSGSSHSASSSSSAGERSSCYSCEVAAKKGPPYDRDEEDLEDDLEREDDEIKALVHGGATSSGGGTLKRADSFEGHEEAVRTLVEAVQESRKMEGATGHA